VSVIVEHLKGANKSVKDTLTLKLRLID